MKLLRYGPAGSERPGVLDSNGAIRDLSGQISDIDPGLLANMDRLSGINVENLPLVQGAPRLGPCCTGFGKFIGIGLNYSDHAAESGLEVPPEPVMFTKATSCIVGPNDDVIIPRGSKKTDWEVELGFVIGKPGQYIAEADALSHVAGFCVVNDVSEREYQIERSGSWDKGKGCDTFGPVGPWLVTPDEVADPQNLDLWLSVNGHKFQDGNTNKMVYGVAFIISYLSQFFTLQAGDIVCTGTPPGVGMGQKPPVYLKAGDVVELGIEGLGTQRQTFVQG